MPLTKKEIAEAKRLVRSLQGTGWLRAEIARAVGVTPAVVTQLMRMSKPPSLRRLQYLRAVAERGLRPGQILAEVRGRASGKKPRVPAKGTPCASATAEGVANTAIGNLREARRVLESGIDEGVFVPILRPGVEYLLQTAEALEKDLQQLVELSG